MIRLDLIFSNWIFVWFLLFYFGLTKYNPSFALLLACIVIIFEIFALLLQGTNEYNIKKFIIMNILLKQIPLLILFLENRIKIVDKDVYFAFVLFFIYNIYLLINGMNIYSIYNKVLYAYIHDIKDPDAKSPYSLAYDYIYSRLAK
jgi:hypothetical protein